MKKANLADPFISPVTGSPRFIDIKSAALTTGKIWQGDSTNSPAEITTDSLFSNFSLQKFTTATLPVNPGKPILFFNTAIS